MEQEINQRIIRISKSANIDKDLQIGHDYIVNGTVNCRSKEDSDNDNGTIDRVFKLWLTGQFDIVNDAGKSIKAKTKGSQSQKLRWDIQNAGRNYEEDMNTTLSHIEDFFNWLDKYKTL